MNERDVTAKVLQAAKKELLRSSAIEIKLCKDNSLPFSALAQHQKSALWHVKHQRLVFKIPDMGYQNPFDAFLLTGAEAFIVVVFYKKQEYKTAYFIDIDDWIEQEEKLERRSLTIDSAMIISKLTVEL